MNAFISEINTISNQLNLKLDSQLVELREAASATSPNSHTITSLVQEVARIQGKIQGLEISRVIAERMEAEAANAAVEAAIWNADPSIPAEDKFQAPKSPCYCDSAYHPAGH